MHTSLAQAMRNFSSQLCIYVRIQCRCMQNRAMVFSLLHITAGEMTTQLAMRSASNFIIQGDVVFIEEHLLHKTSCMRPDVLHVVQK